eukprot:364180-Chlamydomonas_euryale.AAC.3
MAGRGQGAGGPLPGPAALCHGCPEPSPHPQQTQPFLSATNKMPAHVRSREPAGHCQGAVRM